MNDVTSSLSSPAALVDGAGPRAVAVAAAAADGAGPSGRGISAVATGLPGGGGVAVRLR